MRRTIGLLLAGLLFLTPAHAGLKTEDSITMKKISTPSSNPSSGYMKLYFKSDEALYSLNSSGVEAAAGGGGGSGDVTAVGDCASGACLSGIAGGGTTFSLYDGDSNKGSFVTANLNADRTYTFGNLALTFDQSVASGATPTFTGTNITAVATGDSASSFFPAGQLERARGGTGADTSAYGNGLLGSDGSNNSVDVDTEAELETALGGLDVVTVTADDISSANLRSLVSDESGTGAAFFQGGDVGAATGTTASTNDNDTSIATTAFVQAEFPYVEFDLQPAGAILDDSNPPDLAVVESSGTGTPRRLVADFDPTTDQMLYWTFRAPSDLNSGNWTFEIDWFTNDTGANEDAIWYVQMSCTTEGDADSMSEDIAGSANTGSENCNATEANRLIQTTVTLSNLDSVAANDVCTVIVGRDADDSIGDADNDGLTSDARLVNVHVKIPRL